jgi:alpha-glucosidase
LYHDHTPFFTDSLEAKQGERVVLRLRAPGFAPISRAELIVLDVGDLNRFVMKAIPDSSESVSDNSDPSKSDPSKSDPSDWKFFEVELPLVNPTTRYVFMLHTANDSVILSTRGVRHFMPAFRDWFAYATGRTNAAWLEDRVFYQIFPDRFKDAVPEISVRDGEYTYEGVRLDAAGELEFYDRDVVKKNWNDSPSRETNVLEHFGGDLLGITQELGYIEDLGANAIYLNPIFTSPSNHRYDTENFLEVDPHLGGESALRELLDAAHDRGMKVILDGVFNHTGNRLEAFKRALAGGTEQELYSFGPQFGKTGYAAFFGVRSLPKIDFSSPKAFEVFLEGPDSPVRKWIRFGADGWRLDVAQSMGGDATDNGNLEVHRRLRDAVRLENPEAYVFGERFLDAEAALQGADHVRNVGQGGEDGVMNYQGFCSPVTDWLSAERVWNGSVQIPSEEVAEVMFETYRVLPEASRRAQYNLFGSHDIARPLTRFGGSVPKLEAAFTMLFAYPGVPSIYYGDEIGMEGGTDPLNRAPMIWDRSRWNHGVRALVQSLARIRKQSNALKVGSLVWLHAAGDALVFARTFTDQNGQLEVVICLASRSSEVQQVRLDVRAVGMLAGRWQELRSGEVFTASDGLLEVKFTGSGLLLPDV